MKRQIKLWLLVIILAVLTPVRAQQIDWVTDIAWNADGTLVAISHFHAGIEVWSVSTNTLVWSTITSGTTHLDWHPTNSAELAYIPGEGPITIVDIMSDSQLLQIPAYYANSIAYDPTGSRLLISHTNGVTGPGQRGYIRVFDRASGQETTIYEESNERSMYNAKWDNTGQRILALSGGILVIWDAVSGQIIETISELELGSDEDDNTYEVGQMQAFGLNPINNDLAIAETILISFWDAPIYSVKRLETFIGGSVDLEWSADGSFVAAATGPGRIINIIDPVTGEVLNAIDTSSNVSVIAWNPVTSELAIGETTATGEPVILRDPVHDSELVIDSFTLINAVSGQSITGYDPIKAGAVIVLSTLDTNNLAIRANTTLATVGSVIFDLNGIVYTDDTVPYEFRDWTLTPGAYTLTVTPYSESGGAGVAGMTNDYYWSYQPCWLIVPPPTTACTTSGEVQILTEQTTVAQPSTQVVSLAWNSTGSTLASGGFVNGERSLWFTDVTGQITDQYNTPLGTQAVSWHPDGTQVATYGADGYTIRDVNTGSVLLMIPQSGATSDPFVHWNPANLNQIATVEADLVHIRDVATGRILATLDGDGGKPDSNLSAEWSQDGSIIYTVSTDDVIRVWDVASATVTSIIALDYGASSFALSPDRSMLAIGGGDGQVRIHDTTGALIAAYENLPLLSTNNSLHVVWNSDSTKVANVVRSGIEVWDVDSGQVINTIPHLVKSWSPIAVAYRPDGALTYPDVSGNIISAPIASAGSDQTLTADGSGFATTMLDGSLSGDTDGTITGYAWILDGEEIATGINPQVNLGVGVHEIILTVTDDDGATGSDVVVITVEAE